MVWMVLLVLMDLPAPWMMVQQAPMALAVKQAQPVLANRAAGPTAAHILALLHQTDHTVDPLSAYALMMKADLNHQGKYCLCTFYYKNFGLNSIY